MWSEEPIWQSSTYSSPVIYDFSLPTSLEAAQEEMGQLLIICKVINRLAQTVKLQSKHNDKYDICKEHEGQFYVQYSETYTTSMTRYRFLREWIRETQGD